jgi:hypothetical protein
MTSINSLFAPMAQSITASTKAATDNASALMGPFVASTMSASANPTNNAVTGTMQSTMAPQTVNALLSAQQSDPTSSAPIASTQSNTPSSSSPYKYLSADEQNLPDNVKQFLNYMRETPEEQMTDNLLSQMGLTRAQLAAMTPAEQAKVMEKIQQQLEAKMKDNAQNGSSTTSGTDANKKLVEGV